MDPEQQFTDLFAALWPRLYRTAYGVAGDRGAAEDAVQSAMAKAYASWWRIRKADNPEAYVRRMVINEVIGARRSGWRLRERPREIVEHADALPSPETGVADRDAVWTAVLALPVRQRAVIVLRYYEDLSEAEIADALGCSRGTVKSQASAALRNLRSAGIETEGDDR
ncbi:RNA polymerase sigma-70 factor (sigma-E family) [Nocardioides thalensis]|uniref:RNA polymerase sigma-70 factor (Sigma-E family) n=1 Tax=Nocardioides thalensis TaxID=1914755 RepID=A0A853C289_9ACTN|nr:SigE family RNA polymerase sigma factor [Nocardioides thalensis]NYJ02310.1 RNA polymerase sigma-70 factor (sigma-E family) [Nocardioides thalensis]